MAHFHRFPIGDRVLCLDTRHDLVRIANPVAASMWEMHSRGLAVAGIVDAICTGYDAPRGVVEADARRFVAEIEALELASASEAESDEAASDGYRPPDTTPAPARPFAPLAEARLALPGRSILLRSESVEVRDRVAELFSSDGDTNRPEAAADLTMDVFVAGDRFPIVHDGRTLDTGRSAEHAAWLCLREVNPVIAEQAPRLATFHAAALEHAGRAVLLSALSGSGKSTLTAWLVARGHRLLNDDVVTLTLETPHRLLPVPVALSIKQGAWPLLETDYPALASARVYGSTGARPMKYLVPRRDQMLDAPIECSHIVFPRYSPGMARGGAPDRSAGVAAVGAGASPEGEPAPTAWKWIGDGARYRALAVDIALERLIESGGVFDRPFLPERLAQLVRWIERVPCHELRYSSLEDAKSALESLT